MARILFVDDDPGVLSGLRRLLHGRPGWQAAFAGSAQGALRELEGATFDVIVTDLEMPVTSGFDLLRSVSATHPEMVRVILSGEADPDVLMSTVGLAHQFLAKPCGEDELVGALERAVGVRDLLADPRLQGLAARIDNLPSLPGIYRELVEALAREASMKEIGAIVSRDVAMTAKILQLVNSAFLGMRWRVRSAEQAAAILGLRTLKSLVLGHNLFTYEGLSPASQKLLEDLWSRSVEVGSLAVNIAQDMGACGAEQELTLMAGMLHGVGQILFHVLDAEAHLEIMEQARGDGVPLDELERSRYGASYAELGAYLLGIWGLPHDLVEAVRHHAEPPAGAFHPSIPLRALVAALVTVADRELHAAYPGARSPRQTAFLNRWFTESDRYRWRAALHGGLGATRVPV